MIKTININGRQLTFEVEGEGFPVVFIHGFGEDRSVYDDFIAPFSGMYQVIRPDLPGFGDSPPQDGCSISDMADMVNSVLEEINIEQCILIGHSMGGYVGLAFAEKYSYKLRGLGLFHSHPFADTEEKKKGRKEGIEFLERNGARPFVKQLVPKLFGEKSRDKFKTVIDKMIKRGTEAGPDGLIDALNAMTGRPDRSEVLANLKVPVLFIIGKDDELIPWEYSSGQTPLPNVASIHILEDVGHAGMYEAREDTQEIVDNFIAFCLSDENPDK